MLANEVIRPNSKSSYWDVPGVPGRMVHSYNIHGTNLWEIEVIEPTNSGMLDCDYQTICFVESATTGKTELYGVASTKRVSDEEREQRKLECYRDIAECFGWDCLLDLGRVKLNMGRMDLWADNVEVAL